MDLKALRNFSYGVYIVSTWDNGRPTGCIANSAMQITSSPGTIAISINKDNYTNKCIRALKKFAISILGENSSPSLIGTFGFKSGKTENKFDGIDFDVKEYMPIINDACAYVTCDVIDMMETSTHTVFLGQITDAGVISEDTPMTYAYYHNVIKGKSPKNAPTYIPDSVLDENAKKNIDVKEKYKCDVCGYVYDGDIPFENLPDDWVCPICKQPKSKFSKVEN